MRRIVFKSTTGYCGMDGHDFQVYPDNVTEKELDDEAWQLALDNAESYGYYHAPYYEEEIANLEEDSEELDQYIDSIEGWWEDYDPEKHEGLAIGESVEETFKRLEKRFNE